MATVAITSNNTRIVNERVRNGIMLNAGIYNNYNNSKRYSDRPKYVVKAESLELGVYLQQDTFVSEMKRTELVTFIIDYEKRNIKIEFGVRSQQQQQQVYLFKLEIDFKNIDGEIYAEQQGSTRSIIISSKFPARYWLFDRKKDTWKRMTKIYMRKSIGPLQLHMPDSSEHIGKWVAFRVTFDLNQRNVRDMMMKAQDYNLFSRFFSEKTRKVVNTENLSNYINISNLDSDVLYMTECNLSFNYLHYYNLSGEFFSLLSQQPVQSALYILEKIYEEKKRIYNPLPFLRQEIDHIKKNNIKKTQPNHVPKFCVMMRKVIITPTTMHILPPTLETGNRVIRHFRKRKDNFLRVQFLDEASGRIGSSHGNYNETTNDALYNRIYYALHNGIQIGDKHYEFLAFSASQLREHACWFFASTDDLTADKIRNWMGDFSSNKSIAKYAARMGQCFSSTRAIQRLPVNDIKTIPDIKRNGFTFSDGIGKISYSLSRKIAEKLDLRVIPSAFQFRLAGCKGMLCQWPSLPDNQIQVRPSQNKFDSDHNILEIIRCSTYIPSYLNRQAITLLSALGIPDKVFIDLMEERVNELVRMFDSETDAINVLQQNVDEFEISKTLADLVKAGFLQNKDRYLVNLISLFRINMLRDLKKKAKIRVAKGTFLLGVLDETGTLKENEIYCRVSSDPNNPSRRNSITGTCVVWRNPCFHPGDIRVVKAVDCEALHHLVDVIVFPSVGYRDIPNQCSGGDLDGDDFTLIYDERLIPKKTHEPMNYQAQAPVLVDKVEMQHIKTFFVNYVFSDHLGKIANAHLAKADLFEVGAFHGQCIRLAQLHSDAVDFPKSGRPAIFPSELRADKFPDFMEKPDRPSYMSKKVLGTLYRSIEVGEFELYTHSNFDDRLYADGYEEYLEEARKLKRDYDSDVRGLMNQYGILTEFELVSGYIVNTVTKVDKKKPRDIEKSVMEAFMPIKQHYRKEYEREFHEEGSYMILPEACSKMHAKAYAWYYVTYHPSETRNDPDNMISFPWAIHDRMCEIATRNYYKINNRNNRPAGASVQQMGRGNNSNGSSNNNNNNNNNSNNNTAHLAMNYNSNIAHYNDAVNITHLTASQQNNTPHLSENNNIINTEHLMTTQHNNTAIDTINFSDQNQNAIYYYDPSDNIDNDIEKLKQSIRGNF